MRLLIEHMRRAEGSQGLVLSHQHEALFGELASRANGFPRRLRLPKKKKKGIVYVRNARVCISKTLIVLSGEHQTLLGELASRGNGFPRSLRLPKTKQKRDCIG